MDNVAIVCAFDPATAYGFSHRLVAQEVEGVFKKEGVACRIYNFQEKVIPERNILFVGTYTSNVLTYLTRFHDRRVVFYAVVEGFPIINPQALERKVAERITTVVVSRYVQMCLEASRLGCDGVVHLGIDMANRKYDEGFLEWIMESWTKGRQVILYVTGNMPRKGLENYMVASKLVQSRKDVCFILHSGGGPPPCVDVREFAEKIQLNNFWFTNNYGLYSSEQLNALYKAATVYAQPSHCEGFGRPMLEAMRFGLPIVAVNAEPYSEVVVDGETGLLIPCKEVVGVNWMDLIQLNFHYYSVNDLAEAMLKLLDEDKTIKRMKQSIEERCNKFDLQNYRALLSYFK